MVKVAPLRAHLKLRKQRDDDDEGTIPLRMQKVTTGAGPASEVSSLVPVPDDSPEPPERAEGEQFAKALSKGRQHRDEHGKLPSVRELKDLADVGKTTAERALKQLRLDLPE